MNSDFLQLFNDLLTLPSVSSANPHIDMGNRPVIDLLANRFETLGFSCEVMQLTHHPHKANLIATLGTGTGGLVLAGHTDTVPFDEALWQMHPLRLTEKDNRLYGLGSTDMKGFFAVVHEAVKDLEAGNMKHPLIILATADEESSMEGARALVREHRQLGRAAVIGEPTGLTPVNRHKGVMMERLHVQGQSGHSSNPSLGRNALEAMHEMIGALLHYRHKLQHQFKDPHFAIDVPTMNLGVIHGGDNPNRICGHCELEFDVRMLPGMTSTTVRDDIRGMLQSIADRHNTPFTFEPLFPGAEPFENDHSDLIAVCEKLTGQHSQSVAFGTEAPFMQQLGMDTVVLGPGSIDVAHQPNEYMAMDQIQPCIGILQGLIRRYCLYDEQT